MTDTSTHVLVIAEPVHLVRLAADSLADPDAPAAEAMIAVAALIAAVESQVAVGSRVGHLLWAHLQRSPTAPSASDLAAAIGKVASRGLVAEVVQAVLRHDAGRELRSVALDALATPRAASILSDAELLAMAEAVVGRLTYDVAHVVHGAVEGRRIDPATIKVLIGEWRSRQDAHARVAACDLLDLVSAEERRPMVEHVLKHDPSARVRSYCALRLVDLLAPEEAAAVIDDALAHEEHEAVRQDLRRALADLRESYGVGRLSSQGVP